MSYPRYRVRNTGSAFDMKSSQVGTFTYDGGTTHLSYVKTVTWDQLSFSRDVCSDQTNPKRGGHYRTGGPLHIGYVSHEASGVQVHVQTKPPVVYAYKGLMVPIFAIPTGNPGNVPPPADSGSCAAYGASAYAKFKPGKPKAPLATFIGELKDLPQQLYLKAGKFNSEYAKRGLKNPGSAYLAWKFGWAPFVKDLRKMYNLYCNLDASVDRIIKSNGQWVQRGGTVLSRTNVVDTWESVGNISYVPFMPTMDPHLVLTSSYHVKGTKTEALRVWFEGRFRYYLPYVKKEVSYWRPKLVSSLFGADITPDVVWELTPWSWLIDYFSNVGDVISNLTTQTEVVAKYAYIMGHGVTIYEQQSEMSLLNFNTIYPIKGKVVREIGTKTRGAVHPFGLDLAPDVLSEGQLAILAALGASRAK